MTYKNRKGNVTKTREELYHARLSEYFYHTLQSHLLVCAADETESTSAEKLDKNLS